MTGDENAKQRIQSLVDNGKMENTGLKNGMYRINECKHKLKRHAAIK